jgi:hypothetical protein
MAPALSQPGFDLMTHNLQADTVRLDHMYHPKFFCDLKLICWLGKLDQYIL